MKIILGLLWATVACLGLAQSLGTFTATGNTTTGRWFHTATLLANGQVLIAGGSGGAASAELYDPANRTFTATGEMTTRRIFGHTATLLPDGRVLIAGGAIASSRVGVTDTTSAELYDPSTGTFAATGNMIEARACPAAVLLGNGKVLIVGGANWNEPSKAPGAELYDPVSGTFAVAGEYATTNLRRNPDLGLCPKAILLPDGGVLVVWDDQDSSAERFDPSTGTFALAGTMLRPPGLTSPATLLASGKVLFAGGEDGEEAQGVASAELYDPTSGTSIFTGSMTIPRMDHTSTLLPDGTVLITGSQRSGFDGGGALASTELYDPAAGAFSVTGNMTTTRFAHTATLLADGKVLIVGGICNACANTTIAPETSAEIYTPSVLVPAAALLSPTGDGKGQGAFQHADTYQLVTGDNPAVTEEIVGSIAPGSPGGRDSSPSRDRSRMAEVLSFGKTPGNPVLNQINVRVPSGVAPGPAVPVRLTYLGRPGNEVTNKELSAVSYRLLAKRPGRKLIAES